MSHNNAYEALRAEQGEVQATKFPGRALIQYDYYFFPGAHGWIEPPSSDVTDFLCARMEHPEPTLEGLLKNMYAARGLDRKLSWVEMGGGRALAMRQIANMPAMREMVDMTNVDLFDWGIDDITQKEHSILENESPGMTDKGSAPVFVEADVQTVALDRPADLITSLEVVQYLDNPLLALSNWYNQLEDNGIMIVATEWDWASWIRSEASKVNAKVMLPPEQLLLELGKKGVKFAITGEVGGAYRPYRPDQFRALAVERAPATKLQVNSSVAEIRVGLDQFKTVFYEEPKDPTKPMIEVVRS